MNPILPSSSPFTGSIPASVVGDANLTTPHPMAVEVPLSPPTLPSPPERPPSETLAPAVPCSQVGGRLASFIHAWESIGASFAALAIVRSLHMEFTEPSSLSHSRSACDSAKGVGPHKLKLLKEALQNLIDKRAFERQPPP